MHKRGNKGIENLNVIWNMVIIFNSLMVLFKIAVGLVESIAIKNKIFMLKMKKYHVMADFFTKVNHLAHSLMRIEPFTYLNVDICEIRQNNFTIANFGHPVSLMRLKIGCPNSGHRISLMTMVKQI